jgi:hypothetical protein
MRVPDFIFYYFGIKKMRSTYDKYRKYAKKLINDLDQNEIEGITFERIKVWNCTLVRKIN